MHLEESSLLKPLYEDLKKGEIQKHEKTFDESFQGTRSFTRMFKLFTNEEQYSNFEKREGRSVSKLGTF